MASILINLLDWLMRWFYTEEEVDSKLLLKSDIGHTHDTDEILEESALPHLELDANANQHTINLAIDSKIGTGGSGGTAIACVSDFSLDQSDIDDIKLYVDACQGKVIDRISKSSQGLVDTYTIYFDNGDTYVFTVTNGSDAHITIDSEISSTSENAVMNKVIYTALQNKANSTHTHTKSEITDFAHNHNDLYYTETETDNLLDTKQDELVSGTNIKTINNQSILGSGNISIQGGDGSIISVGSFSINNQGNLIVELPNGVDNPYFIDNDGNLIYDTSNVYNGGLIE